MSGEEAIIYILRKWKRRTEKINRQVVSHRLYVEEIRYDKELNRLQIIEDDRRRDLVKHMNLLKEI